MEVVAGGALGAEVRGLDLSCELRADEIERLKRAWNEYFVLVFREQRMEDEALIRFAEYFGKLDPPGPNPYGAPFHKRHPQLNVISNIVEAGHPIGNLGAGEAVWHADLTYADMPPKGAVLVALEIPAGQGNTYFANMYSAYDDLPKSLLRDIQGRMAVHDASHNSAGMLRKGFSEVTDVRQTPGARHPLVRTSPTDGRKCLFLGRRPRSYIVGMDVAQSEALLDALWKHATQDAYTMMHEWQVGDVLMWHNLSVLHRRDAFDSKARRRMHRAQIAGDERIV